MLCSKKLLNIWLSGLCFTLATGLLALCLLNILNKAHPPLRCSNSSILEPDFSHEESPDTVNIWILLCGAVIVPCLQMLIVTPTSSLLPRWFDYLFGLVITLLVNDVAKTTVSAPRPHFLQSCGVWFEIRDCEHGWITNYQCTNSISNWALVDAHKSFPSGHSALGMYSAVYMMFYSQITLRRLNKYTLFCLHTAWLSWAVFCGLSRILDYRHHPIDVAVGFFIGALGAAGVFLLHRPKNPKLAPVSPSQIV